MCCGQSQAAFCFCFPTTILSVFLFMVNKGTNLANPATYIWLLFPPGTLVLPITTHRTNTDLPRGLKILQAYMVSLSTYYSRQCDNLSYKSHVGQWANSHRTLIRQRASCYKLSLPLLLCSVSSNNGQTHLLRLLPEQRPFRSEQRLAAWLFCPPCSASQRTETCSICAEVHF